MHRPLSNDCFWKGARRAREGLGGYSCYLPREGQVRRVGRGSASRRDGSLPSPPPCMQGGPMAQAYWTLKQPCNYLVPFSAKVIICMMFSVSLM